MDDNTEYCKKLWDLWKIFKIQKLTTFSSCFNDIPILILLSWLIIMIYHDIFLKIVYLYFILIFIFGQVTFSFILFCFIWPKYAAIKFPQCRMKKKHKNIFKVIKFHQKVICRRLLFFQKSDGQVTFMFILLICFHKIPPMWDEKKT